MAKNVGPFKFRGMLDDTMFRITEDGNIAGLKTGPSSEKVLTHENFDRTRRNAAEFKMAVQDGAELRYALGRALDGKVGSSLNGRMNGLMHLIAQQDPINGLGSRRACYGDVGLLNGFDFNKQVPMSKAWKLKCAHSLDAVNGVFKLVLLPFVAHKKKVFPKEATHFRIISGGVAVDFVRRRYERVIKESALLPLSRKTRDSICFDYAVKVKPGEVLVQVLGIEFYKIEKGEEVLVKGSVLQVLEAVKAVERSEPGIQRLELEVPCLELEEIRMEDELHELEEVVVCEETNEDIAQISRWHTSATSEHLTTVKGNGFPVRVSTNQGGGPLWRSAPGGDRSDPGTGIRNSGICVIFATLLLENESFKCPGSFRISDPDP